MLLTTDFFLPLVGFFPLLFGTDLVSDDGVTSFVDKTSWETIEGSSLNNRSEACLFLARTIASTIKSSLLGIRKEPGLSKIREMHLPESSSSMSPIRSTLRLLYKLYESSLNLAPVNSGASWVV